MYDLRSAPHDDALAFSYDHMLSDMFRTFPILSPLGFVVIGVLVITTALAVIAVPAVSRHHDCESQEQNHCATVSN
jgi:hypothetical protein